MHTASWPPVLRQRPIPIPRWEPSIDVVTLARVLVALSPEMVLSRVLDAAGDVLGDQRPPEHTLPALDVPLRAGLDRLAHLAGRSWIEVPVARLVRRFTELQEGELPTGTEGAQIHIWQRALTAEALLEHLIESGAMGELERRHRPPECPLLLPNPHRPHEDLGRRPHHPRKLRRHPLRRHRCRAVPRQPPRGRRSPHPPRRRAQPAARASPGPLLLRAEQPDLRLSLNGTRLVVVENLQAAETLCDTLDAITPDNDTGIVYCAGMPSRAIVDHIAALADSADRIIIAPDADLGGVRIATRRGKREGLRGLRYG